jgi:hypothetical protein
MIDGKRSIQDLLLALMALVWIFPKSAMLTTSLLRANFAPGVVAQAFNPRLNGFVVRDGFFHPLGFMD